jgi:hypothetical protein
MPPRQQNKPAPPSRENPAPPTTDIKKTKDGSAEIDVDDAMIEEPKEDVFKKNDEGVLCCLSAESARQRRKTAKGSSSGNPNAATSVLKLIR